MDFRVKIFLLILFSGFLKSEAQTVGVYGEYFFTNGSYIYENGSSLGITANNFFKSKFNPGIDINIYTKNESQNNTFAYTCNNCKKDDPITNFATIQTNYNQNIQLVSINTTLEYIKKPDDTLLLVFSPQIGFNYFHVQRNYSNADVPDIKQSKWVPSYGIYGSIYRNYLFSLPLQAFLKIGIDTYIVGDFWKSQVHELSHVSNKYFKGDFIIMMNFKVGLAYKFN